MAAREAGLEYVNEYVTLPLAGPPKDERFTDAALAYVNRRHA
jgi:hypothetical protein